ncbi:acyltransferase family protein [Desulfobacula sp.]|uniref:acyltransferase family protein n=1 Tax=Desulfobacula sp. TaxID=2593537 RepID=UPI002611E678|nr:acyltransferase family protein [Desulfobacula sp.]
MESGEKNYNFFFEVFKSILLSCLRILATAGIFFFHILGLYGFDNRGIDFFSIIIFCFLSGYLLHSVKLNSFGWLKSRFLSIMIPYWLVIVPVLIINRIISYKETTVLGDFITLLGGNMFLRTKVYVIAWYITFVLLLYAFVYVQSFFENPLLKVLIWMVGLFIFGIILNKFYYFMSFGIGFFLSNIFIPPDKNIAKSNHLSKALFVAQGHCYGFFLIHGGVLLCLFNILNFNITNAFLVGILLSAGGAIVLHLITKFRYQ